MNEKELQEILTSFKKAERTPADTEGLQDKEFEDVNVVNKGKKIIIPEDMSYTDAINWIKRKRKQEETEVAVQIKVDAFPLDGACATMDVLKIMYGWSDLVPRPSFFGPQPPQMISVETGPNGESRQVPWGDMQIPKIEGTLTTGFTMDDDRPCFELRGVVKRKHEKVIQKIGDAIKERVKTHSIYRGKAIRMRFRDQDGDRIKFNPSIAPKFEDLKGIRPEDLIFSRETAEQLETSLFTPVEYTDACRDQNIPLKRGVLLEGPFGTGKTLTAAVLASICVENGWTFLYVEDVRDLDMALKFARLYQPCVVFGEDIDRAVGIKRNSDVDQILNTLDGIGSKKAEIFTVLTTNNVEVIGPAFLRPGRIDTVVHIGPPDEEAAVKLVRLYGNGRVEGSDAEIASAVEPVIGSNAAFLQEVTERSNLAAVRRTKGEGDPTIHPTDIKYAADQMAAHLRLSSPDKEGVEDNPIETFAKGLGDQLMKHTGLVKKVAEKTAEATAEKLNG